MTQTFRLALDASIRSSEHATGYSGPHGIGDGLGLVGFKAPGLELARHRQGIKGNIHHAGKVAPPTR